VRNANAGKRKVFYGWWVVCACFFIALYTGGIVVFGFTALFEPITSQFGWSYTQISLAATLNGLLTGLTAPLVGLLVDRWGPRKLVFGGVIISCLGFMLLSRITSLPMFYGAFLLIYIGYSATSGVVMMTAVANWFRQNIAMAAGVAATGFAMGGLLVPLVTMLVDTFKWQTAIFSLGLGMLLIPLPLSLLFRRRPEEKGYLPNGDAGNITVASEDLTSVTNHGANVSVKRVLKGRAFWHIAMALMCQGVALNAVTVHVMPYLGSVGIARSTSSLAVSAITVTNVVGRLTFGWFGDRIEKRRIAAASLALTTLSLFCLGYVPSGGVWLLVPFLILFGFGFGGQFTMISPLLTGYFGRSRFGTIYGFTHAIMQLGGTIGPPLAGWVFDKWGSYQSIWFVFTGLSIAAVVIMASTPPIGNPIEPAEKPRNL
jgi:MFS family permease